MEIGKKNTFMIGGNANDGTGMVEPQGCEGHRDSVTGRKKGFKLHGRERRRQMKRSWNYA